jgi:ribonuclease P protein component
VLANNARIKRSVDFSKTTKAGRRIATQSLIGYLLITDSNEPAKLGLIVGKNVGNSVVRHRVARQIRHGVREEFLKLPNGSLFVVRALNSNKEIFNEAKVLMQKFSARNGATV